MIKDYEFMFWGHKSVQVKKDLYTVAEMGLRVTKYSQIPATVKTEYASYGSRKRTNFALVNVSDLFLFLSGG